MGFTLTPSVSRVARGPLPPGEGSRGHRISRGVRVFSNGSSSHSTRAWVRLVRQVSRVHVLPHTPPPGKMAQLFGWALSFRAVYLAIDGESLGGNEV